MKFHGPTIWPHHTISIHCLSIHAPPSAWKTFKDTDIFPIPHRNKQTNNTDLPSLLFASVPSVDTLWSAIFDVEGKHLPKAYFCRQQKSSYSKKMGFKQPKQTFVQYDARCVALQPITWTARIYGDRRFWHWVETSTFIIRSLNKIKTFEKKII